MASGRLIARREVLAAGAAAAFGFPFINRGSFAFAAASSVTAEIGTMWPHYKLAAGTALYGGATLVGLSRMYHNRHWSSDVAIGAAVGTFSGWKVVQYTHDHQDNAIDRIMLGTTVVPTSKGFTVMWTSHK